MWISLSHSTQEGRKLTEIGHRNLAARYITKPDISISNIEKCQPTEKWQHHSAAQC